MTEIKLPTHKKFVNIAGQRFSRLTVISYVGQGKWNCICSCGKTKLCSKSHLTTSYVKSCGCLKSETTANKNYKHGCAVRGSKTTEYHSWEALKQRCLNLNNPDYYNYGGRGIIICDRWLESFENFLTDMGLKPSPKHSIDRIDSNGDYEPNNCKWSTALEQGRNTRRNRIIEYNGIKMTVSEAAIIYGLKYNLLSDRLNKLNWSIGRALHEEKH